MSFDALLAELRDQHPHGRLSWNPEHPLRASLRRAAVPDAPCAYVLTASGNQAPVIVYVGHAGTITSDGTFSSQKLAGRLKAKQGGVPRQEYFRGQLKEGGFTELGIEWFVTWREGLTVAPALVEARLLQAYLMQFGRLPSWNKSF